MYLGMRQWAERSRMPESRQKEAVGRWLDWPRQAGALRRAPQSVTSLLSASMSCFRLAVTRLSPVRPPRSPARGQGQRQVWAGQQGWAGQRA